MYDWKKEREEEEKWKAENKASAEQEIIEFFEEQGGDYQETVAHFYDRCQTAHHPQALPCHATKRRASFLYEIARRGIPEKK